MNLNQIVKDFGDICIIKVYANENDCIYGSINNSIEEVKNEFPESFTLEGFCIFDKIYGAVPDDAKDWHSTMDEAIAEYNLLYKNK